MIVDDVRQPGDRLTAAQRGRYIVILGFLTALGPFTIDLYLPAFPAVAADLMTTQAAIQLTLAGTTIGLAIGQLLVGPWSDKVGRKLPLVLSTGVHVASCIIAATAINVEVLGVSRVVMGAAAAAGGIMALAMVRDLFVGLRMMRIVSQLAMISGLAPILAPLIGSQLLVVTSWRGIFVFLAAYSVVIGVVALVFIVETLPKSVRRARGENLPATIRILLADRVYVGLLLVGGMVWGCEFSYLASTPFLFQEVYGFSTGAYALMFAINAAGFVLGNQLSARIAHKLAPQWLLAVGTSIMIAAAAGVIVAQLVDAGSVVVMVCLWFSVAAVGVCVPCLQVLGLARHGAHAGTAAAFMGASNFGIAALVTPLSGLLETGDALGMGALMLAASVIASLALWLIVRPRTVLELPR